MIGWSLLLFPCRPFEVLVAVCLVGAGGMVGHFPFGTLQLNVHKLDGDCTIPVLVVLPICLGCRSTNLLNDHRLDGYHTTILFEVVVYPCLLVVLEIAS